MAQRELARAIIELGKPVIVLCSPDARSSCRIGCLSKPRPFWRCDSWAEAGNAAGDVLSGRFNPTGRLSISWPVDVGQIPIFFGQRSTGRPAEVGDLYSIKYIDLPVEPLYDFWAWPVL
jgi:beta-glucosidase